MTDILVTFTNEDLLRGTLVEPAVWYRCKITACTTKMSAKGDSTNFNAEMRIIRNADTGDTRFQNVPVTARFNSQAIGFMKGLFEACGVEVAADRPFNFGALEGMEVDVFVERGEYDNKANNTINHKYRKAA